ncbi:hypothetical protein V8J88_20140 [Massilia sp. W12]|uniref:hypothetical protein n=1 Tax=Massilia sp. W12 TaxID=3126507 RepID=UPI0030D3623B
MLDLGQTALIQHIVNAGTHPGMRLDYQSCQTIELEHGWLSMSALSGYAVVTTALALATCIYNGDWRKKSICSAHNREDSGSARNTLQQNPVKLIPHYA